MIGKWAQTQSNLATITDTAATAAAAAVNTATITTIAVATTLRGVPHHVLRELVYVPPSAGIWVE